MLQDTSISKEAKQRRLYSAPAFPPRPRRVARLSVQRRTQERAEEADRGIAGSEQDKLVCRVQGRTASQDDSGVELDAMDRECEGAVEK